MNAKFTQFPEKRGQRLANNAASTAKTRANETPEQTAARRARDARNHARIRQIRNDLTNRFLSKNEDEIDQHYCGLLNHRCQYCRNCLIHNYL